jgi:phospholipid/cholesterol/gamma-HCH transport system permease protein
MLLTIPEDIGRASRLWFALLQRLHHVLRDRALVTAQVIRLGISSSPLVIIISLFIGAVTAVQVRYQFHGLIPDTYIGTAVAKFVIIESAPVLTALVLAGRVGAAIAAEIAAMKEKEELQAYEVLGLDPLRYLGLPRILAGLITFPVLTVFSCVFALFGGWFLSRTSFNLTTETYVQGARFLFSSYDVFVCMLKALIFGGVVAFAGYHAGLRAAPGARGTGQAAMRAVVSACVWILVLDFVIIFVMY